MLTHPTLDLLHDLGLHGMAKGFRDMADNPESAALGHAEWLGILLERESTLRQQKRFESRAKTAKLRHQAAADHADVSFAGRYPCRQRDPLLLPRPRRLGRRRSFRDAFSGVAIHRACGRSRGNDGVMER